jgi:hypothetical protein
MSSSCSHPSPVKRPSSSSNSALRPFVSVGYSARRLRTRGGSEHLALGIVGFYQPVGVEKHALPRCQDSLVLFIGHPRHQPKWHPLALRSLAACSWQQHGKLCTALA